MKAKQTERRVTVCGVIPPEAAAELESLTVGPYTRSYLVGTAVLEYLARQRKAKPVTRKAASR